MEKATLSGPKDKVPRGKSRGRRAEGGSRRLLPSRKPGARREGGGGVPHCTKPGYLGQTTPRTRRPQTRSEAPPSEAPGRDETRRPLPALGRRFAASPGLKERKELVNRGNAQLTAKALLTKPAPTRGASGTHFLSGQIQSPSLTRKFLVDILATAATTAARSYVFTGESGPGAFGTAGLSANRLTPAQPCGGV